MTPELDGGADRMTPGERFRHAVTGSKWMLTAGVICIATIGLFAGRLSGGEWGASVNAALLFYSGANFLNNREALRGNRAA